MLNKITILKVNAASQNHHICADEGGEKDIGENPPDTSTPAMEEASKQDLANCDALRSYQTCIGTVDQ